MKPDLPARMTLYERSLEPLAKWSIILCIASACALIFLAWKWGPL